jgi:hypothetical protein
MSMICGPDDILAKPANHNGKIANGSLREKQVKIISGCKG